jgi:hypothetical protein
MRALKSPTDGGYSLSGGVTLSYSSLDNRGGGPGELRGLALACGGPYIYLSVGGLRSKGTSLETG